MQFIMRVPRLQESYIKVHGVDDFIQRFTDILAEYETIVNQKNFQK